VEILHAGEASQASADAEILARPANLSSGCSVPTPGNAPARYIDLTAVELEDDLAQSAADIAPPRAHPGVNDAIDQLTADLAVFCFDRFERSLTLGNEDQGSPNDFEDKL